MDLKQLEIRHEWVFSTLLRRWSNLPRSVLLNHHIDSDCQTQLLIAGKLVHGIENVWGSLILHDKEQVHLILVFLGVDLNLVDFSADDVLELVVVVAQSFDFRYEARVDE